MNEEFQQVTDALVSMANQLMEIADKIQDINIHYGEPVKAETNVEVKKTITLEQVRGVLAEKSRAGYTEQIRGLLKKYGADRLSAVNPEKFEALLKDAEVLGND